MGLKKKLVAKENADTAFNGEVTQATNDVAKEQEAKKAELTKLYRKRYFECIRGNDTVLIVEDPQTLDFYLFPARLIEPYQFKIVFIDSEKEWDLFFAEMAEIEGEIQDSSWWSSKIGNLTGAGGITVMHDSNTLGAKVIVIGHRLEGVSDKYRVTTICHEITHAVHNIMSVTGAYDGFPHSQEPVAYLFEHIMGFFLDHIYMSKGYRFKLEKEVEEVEVKQLPDKGTF